MKKEKTNEQTILEAKANIDIARMMLALNNIKTSTDGLSTYTLDNMEKGFKEAMKFIQSMQELKKLKGCVFNEARIAKDIVDGIKSKSMYIEKIEELNKRITITEDLNNKYLLENQRIKKLLVNFIEKFEIGKEQIDIDFINRELNVSVKPIREIQEAGWNIFLSRLPEKCKIEENPF